MPVPSTTNQTKPDKKHSEENLAMPPDQERKYLSEDYFIEVPLTGLDSQRGENLSAEIFEHEYTKDDQISPIRKQIKNETESTRS